MKKKRVILGLSGGVDSSVAAYLLREQGYEVICVFMKNWHENDFTLEDECPWIDDSREALIAANHLDLPYYSVDFSEEYKKQVVDYMFSEYQAGRTPNPDVMCNQKIKFDVFMNKMMSQFDADYIATGHYARTRIVDGEVRLLKAIDPSKDQSYFLCRLNQDQLSKAIFPLGGMLKSEVRELAHEIGLNTAARKDSQGLCFVGHINLPDFLSQAITKKEGDVKLIGTDRIVGRHIGVNFYTIGQRKGLQLKYPNRVFIVKKDIENNVIWVAEENDPSRYTSKIKMSNIMTFRSVEKDLELTAQIRYHGEFLSGKLNGSMFELDKPTKDPIASGQFIVIYKEDEIVSSGIIEASQSI